MDGISSLAITLYVFGIIIGCVFGGHGWYRILDGNESRLNIAYCLGGVITGFVVAMYGAWLV